MIQAWAMRMLVWQRRVLNMMKTQAMREKMMGKAQQHQQKITHTDQSNHPQCDANVVLPRNGSSLTLVCSAVTSIPTVRTPWQCHHMARRLVPSCAALDHWYCATDCTQSWPAAGLCW